MSLTALSTFLATIPPNLWVGALIGGFFLCLKAHIEGRAAKDVQRLMNVGQAGKLRSEEKQLAMKHGHEAREWEHKANERSEERKHEQIVALITARGHPEGKGMTLAA